MKALASPLFALAGIGFLTLVAAPAEPQEPPDESTGGLARTEEAIGALGRLADMPDLIPSKQAINAYNRGLAYRDKAWKLEEQAATADGKKAAHKAAGAQKSYKKAIVQFRIAVKHVPEFHQALGCLGYVLLETGQYEEALETCDRALALGPLYPEAIEERGEAYLGLNRIEDAKSAYMELSQIDRELAAELMSVMRRWLDRRRNDAGGLSEAAIESFAVWIEERSGPVGSRGVGQAHAVPDDS